MTITFELTIDEFLEIQQQLHDYPGESIEEAAKLGLQCFANEWAEMMALPDEEKDRLKKEMIDALIDKKREELESQQ